MLVSGYNTLEDMPTQSSAEITGRLMRQKRSLRTVLEHIEGYEEARGDLQYVLRHPGQFDINDSRLEDLRRQLKVTEQSVTNLREWVEYITVNPDAELPGFHPVERVAVDWRAKPATAIVWLFEGADFGDRKVEISESIDNLNAIGLGGALTSLILHGKPGEYTIELFASTGFQDKLIELQSPVQVSNLGNFPTPVHLRRKFRQHPSHCNDKVGSILVRKNQ